jgi:hypothetical protein
VREVERRGLVTKDDLLRRHRFDSYIFRYIPYHAIGNYIHSTPFARRLFIICHYSLAMVMLLGKNKRISMDQRGEMNAPKIPTYHSSDLSDAQLGRTLIALKDRKKTR